MASLQQLETALRNADAAGDVEAATKIAGAIRATRGAAAPNPKASEEAQLKSWAANRPVASFAAKTLQGIPFAGEYTDEAMGWVGESLMGNPNATRQARALQNNDMGWGTDLAAGAVGGVASAAATLPMLPLRAAGAMMPASVGGRAVALAPVGGVVGGAEGAVSGYGSGTDPESRKENAKTGAMIGAGVGTGLGLASPVIGEGVKRGANAVFDWATINKRAQNAGFSPESIKLLANALEGDDALTGVGAQRMRDAGPGAMVADAGPGMRSILDVAIQKSGPGGRIARQNVEQRAADSLGTMNNALDASLGRPQGVTATETGIRKGSASGRRTAYDAAYSSPINYSDPAAMDLQTILKRVPGNAIAAANNLMRVEGVQSKQILAKIGQDGSVTYERLPDVRQLDYITRGLKEVADQADGQGKLGGQTATGRAYGNLAKEIRDTLGGLVPEYRNALATAADPIRRREALRTGEGALSPSVARDEFRETLQGITPAERDAMKQGVRSRIDDALANVTRAVSDGNMDAREAIKAARDLSSRAAREKIADLIGQSEANNLFSQLDQATKALELRAGVADNSKTFARTSLDNDIKNQLRGGPISALSRGEPVNATKRLVQALTGKTPEADLAKEQSIYTDLARILTEKRGPDAMRAAGQIATLVKQYPNNVSRARALARLLTAGGAVSSYQGLTQLPGTQPR